MAESSKKGLRAGFRALRQRVRTSSGNEDDASGNAGCSSSAAQPITPAPPVDAPAAGGAQDAPGLPQPAAAGSIAHEAPAAAGPSSERQSSFEWPWEPSRQQLRCGTTVWDVNERPGLKMLDTGSKYAFKVNGVEFIPSHTWIPLHFREEADRLQGNHYFWHNWQTGERRREKAQFPEIPPVLALDTLQRFEDQWSQEGGGQPFAMDSHLRRFPSMWAKEPHVDRGVVRKPPAESSVALGFAFDSAEFTQARRLMQYTPVEPAKEREKPPFEGKDELMHGVFIYPEPTSGFVRRRALLVACTYKQNQWMKEEKMLLKNTVDDAKKWFDMLLGRGFQAQDVVLLTDDQKSASACAMRDAGARVDKEGSTLLNISTWICRLASGLDGTPSHVANSLFFFLAGHGEQYREKGKGVPLRVENELVYWGQEGNPDWLRIEDDGKDEAFVASDFNREKKVIGHTERNGRQVPVYDVTDYGVLLDDYVNDALVKTVHGCPNTQLVIAADACNTGTIADLPFQLRAVRKGPNRTESYEDNFWRSSGIARRCEEELNAPLHPWFCGKGIVYSFGAAKDGNAATDSYRDTTDEEEVGNLTKAFMGSDLARPSDTSLLHGFEQIQKAIDSSNESWKKRLQEEYPDDWNKENFLYGYLFRQKPRLGCSHFCVLNRPLTL